MLLEILQQNIIYYTLSIFISLWIFIYNIYLLNNFIFIEEVIKVKNNIKTYIREYFFYIFFILIWFCIIAFIENIYVILFYISLLLISLFTYLFQWEKNTDILLEIERIKLKKVYKKNNHLFWFLLMCISFLLWYFLIKNWNVITWYTSPIIYSILYWISFTDKKQYIILERYLVLLLLLWIIINTLFISMLKENIIILFIMSFIILLILWTIDRFRKSTTFWYMDFPIAFSLAFILYSDILYFLWFLFFLTWIQWIVNFKQKDYKVWLFWYSNIVFIITLVFLLIQTKFSLLSV